MAVRLSDMSRKLIYDNHVVILNQKNEFLKVHDMILDVANVPYVDATGKKKRKKKR